LRGCIDFCKRLFLDTGREQREINKEFIDKMLACYKDPIGKQGC